MSCPKCGTGTFDGPRYVPANTSGVFRVEDEHLAYTCKRCGYVRKEQTVEQRRAAESVQAANRAIRDFYEVRPEFFRSSPFPGPMKDITPRPKQIESKKETT